MTDAAFICATDFISIFYINFAGESASFKNSHFSEKCEFLLIFLLKVRVYGTYVILDYLGIIGKTRTFRKMRVKSSIFRKARVFTHFLVKMRVYETWPFSR
jgi:hypothetical protein